MLPLSDPTETFPLRIVIQNSLEAVLAHPNIFPPFVLGFSLTTPSAFMISMAAFGAAHLSILIVFEFKILSTPRAFLGCLNIFVHGEPPVASLSEFESGIRDGKRRVVGASKSTLHSPWSFRCERSEFRRYGDSLAKLILSSLSGGATFF